MVKHFTIAIDGPAGSGKSTVAKMVARELGFLYMDTGAMYRTVAYFCRKHQIDWTDEAKVVAALPKLQMNVQLLDGKQHIFLEGEDVTDLVRTPEIGKGASSVGTFLPVRECMVRLQQSLAADVSVVMDGRDIGTKVLPDAPLKIYLDAGVEERARRRMGELAERGETADFAEICQQIRQRDEQDMHRTHSPLVQAEDAVFLDSTSMTAEEVTQRIIALAKERME